MPDTPRDLEADLQLLTAIPRDPDDPVDMVHDVVAPHALRRAIAADAESANLKAEFAEWIRQYKRLEAAALAMEIVVSNSEARAIQAQQRLKEQFEIAEEARDRANEYEGRAERAEQDLSHMRDMAASWESKAEALAGQLAFQVRHTALLEEEWYKRAMQAEQEREELKAYIATQAKAERKRIKEWSEAGAAYRRERQELMQERDEALDMADESITMLERTQQKVIELLEGLRWYAAGNHFDHEFTGVGAAGMREDKVLLLDDGARARSLLEQYREGSTQDE